MRPPRISALLFGLVLGLSACGGHVVFDTSATGSGGSTSVGNGTPTSVGASVGNGTSVVGGQGVTVSSSVNTTGAVTGGSTGAGCTVTAPAGEKAQNVCFNRPNGSCPPVGAQGLQSSLQTLINTERSGCAVEKVAQVACAEGNASGQCCYAIVTSIPCMTGG